MRGTFRTLAGAAAAGLSLLWTDGAWPETAPVSAPADSTTAAAVDSSAAATARPAPSSPSPVTDFVAIPDRWRDIQPPPYELNVPKHWYDPYNRNSLKGDYPVFGDNTFLALTGITSTIVEGTSNFTPSGVSAERPESELFFGKRDKLFVNQTLKLTLELYHGDTAFRPRDWEIRATPVFNVNYANTRENNSTNINVRRGSNRLDHHLGFQELSLEKHLLNVGDRFDFVAVRGGIQRFSSDFRGFVFNDNNLGARLFGNLRGNRYQYNLALFHMLEKDTNSELNTVFDERDQEVAVANLYRQDTGTPGYTAQLSFLYNLDLASVHYDENGFLVRPALAGGALPHRMKAYYLGWTGDGHWGRLNVDHAFYQVFGDDRFNPLANRAITINAQMAALELSMDKDWMRFKVAGFFSSGDRDPADSHGRGFDTIVDSPVFAGGALSYWNTQAIRLQGVALVGKESLVPALRSSKTEGQPNFVNPGLILAGGGWDADLTPQLRLAMNANYLRFVDVKVIEAFVNQSNIGHNIGLDYGVGLFYRPFLNNNANVALVATGLSPLEALNDIYESPGTQYSVQTSVSFRF